MKSLGSFIRYVRKSKELTQEQIAESLFILEAEALLHARIQRGMVAHERREDSERRPAQEQVFRRVVAEPADVRAHERHAGEA